MHSDPLRDLLEGGIKATEWHSTMFNAMGLLDKSSPTNIARLLKFFRDFVIDHFALEDDVVFPALLKLEPSPQVQNLLRELSEEHAKILADCSRLFETVALHQQSDDPTQHDQAIRSQAQTIIQEVLAHAAREDAEFLPLAEKHREVIAPLLPRLQQPAG